MSDVFFSEMSIPKPDANLMCGGMTHGKMTGEMLVRIEEILLERKPDYVVVYGDTNSTLAGSLAASKLNIPLVHIEAGLRSYNKQMPEEQNRIVADHLSTFLFCPTSTAVANLAKEGFDVTGNVPVSRDVPYVCDVGDIMLDASLFYRQFVSTRPEKDSVLTHCAITRPYWLFTLHRAENTDSPERMKAIFDGLNAAKEYDIVFPLHPRTKKFIESYHIRIGDHIRIIDPVGYFDMLELEQHCVGIVTDSGGVQKEAVFFEKPCVTLRDQTEWVETVSAGWNRLVGADTVKIIDALKKPWKGASGNLYGDGSCGRKIVDTLKDY
jgi:UDP-GlcNAc3NAcA epimerase